MEQQCTDAALKKPDLIQSEAIMLKSLIRFCLYKKPVILILFFLMIVYGISVMPFDVNTPIPRNPVAVDAIPDIGENQQIVFTQWPGRSPQDIDEQITYPLTVGLLGMPGVKTIRSTSMFGFSSIYIIFEDNIDFYWSRARILERLNTVGLGLPEGVRPVLGPDATALGQVFWYTLEGRGFDQFELRSIQDWQVKYMLESVPGVAEVASVGGKVLEYQIDIDPQSLQAYNVTIPEIVAAVKQSNLDVGANTIEINNVEYIVRGLGFIRSIDDLKNIVVKSVGGTPVTLSQLGKIVQGPAGRRGALDKEGAEAVGGVVVTAYGENPLQVINDVKEKIEEISPGLPRKVLDDGTSSQVEIVPFYDRTQLINETLDTLKRAITDEILITIIVVIILLMQIKSSFLISGLLPVTVLITFILMKLFNVEGNIMSLAGIAIAIGDMVDMGVIVCENIVRHVNEAAEEEPLTETVYRAVTEVGSAIVVSISTTVVCTMAIFVMTGSEGKLFKPLAMTYIFSIVSALLVSLTLLPVLANILFKKKFNRYFQKKWLAPVALIASGLIMLASFSLPAYALIVWGVALFAAPWLESVTGLSNKMVSNMICVMVFVVLLSFAWQPLGAGRSIFSNIVFVVTVVSIVSGIFKLFIAYYEKLLRIVLSYKPVFFCFTLALVLFGSTIWLGFDTVFGFMPASWRFIGGSTETIRSLRPWVWASHKFPGLGREFMPPLDEGSYLLMPTTMPHASIGEALDVMRKQNMAIRAIDEVKDVVGKIGRVESALDPAPVSMIETIINIIPEYSDPDPETGKVTRQWRDHIRRADDIWDEIVKASRIVGTTSAPRLQPISARIVMLQTGIRASMGIQIQGRSLDDIENFALKLESVVQDVPGVNPATVFADRVVGKPYLEIEIDREAIARYNILIKDVQDIIETAIGGTALTYSFEGRERYAVRLRYARELRDHPEAIARLLINSSDQGQVSLGQIADINFTRGPQAIRSENTFPVSYLIFDKESDFAEANVVEAVRDRIRAEIDNNNLVLPDGVSYRFVGSYQNQLRAEQTLRVIIPVTFLLILLLLYLQFNSIVTGLLVFCGVFMAWSGGFILLWLYSQPWFLNFSLFSVDVQDLFNIRTYNLSIAVWVGFIVVFGLATDDGVVMTTYLDNNFNEKKPKTVDQIREAVVAAGLKRVRPCLMTSATTILALIPIITSTGRGADVMIPMALPSIGGMAMALITLFLVPAGYCMIKELSLKK